MFWFFGSLHLTCCCSCTCLQALCCTHSALYSFIVSQFFKSFHRSIRVVYDLFVDLGFSSDLSLHQIQFFWSYFTNKHFENVLWFFLIDYNHFDFFYTFSSSCDFGHLSLHSHGRIIDWVSFSALHRGVYHAFASDVSSCSIFFSVNAGWMFYGHVQHLYCANWFQDLLVIFEALVHPLIVLPHHVLVGFICQHPVGPHQYFFSSHQHGHC